MERKLARELGLSEANSNTSWIGTLVGNSVHDFVEVNIMNSVSHVIKRRSPDDDF